MSVFAASNGIGFAADTAFGVGTSVQRILQGNQSRTRFVRGGVTLVEFDLVISESHAQQAAPTAFPIELAGQTICDHIVVAPKTVQLTGLISDKPLGDKNSLRREAMTTAAGLVGPAGVAALGIASALAQKDSLRPSIAAFNQLRFLAAGGVDPNEIGPPSPFGPTVQGPSPFDVVFPYLADKPGMTTYKSMVITSLECQLDSSTGDALVFTVSLSQVRTVTGQSQIVTTQPLAQAKQSVGRVEAKERLEESDKNVVEFGKGRITGRGVSAPAGSQ